MLNLRCCRQATAIALLVIASNAAHADIVVLEFDSLPSAQGWTFVKSDTGSHADDNETDVFSVLNDTLTMNTIGSGLVSPSSLGYEIAGVAETGRAWVLESRLKIVQYESSAGSDFQFGSLFSVHNGVSVGAIALSNDDVTLVDGDSTKTVSNDNTSFQTFRLEFTPDADTGTYDLFIDDEFIVSAAGRSSSQNKLFIGDGTGAANSEWDMTSYSFSSIPEPSPLIPISLAFVGLACYPRRRRNLSWA